MEKEIPIITDSKQVSVSILFIKMPKQTYSNGEVKLTSQQPVKPDPMSRLLNFVAFSLLLLTTHFSSGAPSYSVTVLPTGALNSPHINDKGQVIGVEGSNTVRLYLPSADYAFPDAGVYTIPIPPDVTSVRFTDFNINASTTGNLVSSGYSGPFYSTNGTQFDPLGTAPKKLNDLGHILLETFAFPAVSTGAGRIELRPFFDYTPLHPASIPPPNSIAGLRDIENGYPAAINYLVTDINDSGVMSGYRVDGGYVGRRLGSVQIVVNGPDIFFDAAPGEDVINTSHFDQTDFSASHKPLTLTMSGGVNFLPGFPDPIQEFPEGPSYPHVPAFPYFSSSTSAAINNRNEVFGFLTNPSRGFPWTRPWIYLPETAHGLPAGLNIIESFYVFVGGLDPILTDSGDIFYPSGVILDPTLEWPNAEYPDFTLWRRGEIVTVTDHLVTGGRDIVLTDWHDINNDGVILATGTVDGGAPTLLLLNPDDVLTLSVDPDQPTYHVGDRIVAEIGIRHTLPQPATYRFVGEQIYEAPENSILSAELEPVDEFILSTAQPQRRFVVPLDVIEKGGTTIHTVLERTGGTGDIQRFSAQKKIVVSALELSIRALPEIDGESIVNMKIIEDPETGAITITDEDDNPITPKIEVTFENTSDQDLKVILQGLDAKARDDSSIVGRINTAVSSAIDIGTVPGNSSVTKEYDIEITQDGRFEFSAVATAVYIGTEFQFNAATTGAPIAVGEPYPVELEFEVIRTPVITNNNNGAALIQPGGSLKVLATVENRTTNATLQFYGIRAKKSFNAFGASITSEEGNLTEPAFVHDHSVDAGASVVLTGIIRTSKDGAPNGLIEWQGLEDIVLVDDATGEETELTMDDVIVRTTGAQITGWLGNPLALRVIQDNSRPDAPLLSYPEIIALRTGHFSYGAMISVAEWTYDTFDGIGGLGRLAGTIYEDPDILANVMGEASRAVWEAAGLVANTWARMTPAQKEEFIQSLVSEVARRAALLATARAPFSQDEAQAALEYTRNATFFLFNGVTEAYEDDDPARIAEMWGNVSGHVGMEVITAAISEIKFTKYVDGTEALRLLDNNKIGPALTNQEAALRLLKSGPLSDSTTLAAFGPGPEDLRAFEKVFKAFGVKGYARERAPISYSLINQRKVAIWKAEAMKPKGISDIDLLILGDSIPTLPGSDGSPVNLKGVTAIFWPEPDDVLVTRLINQPPEVLNACLARAKKRRKEFSKYYPNFRQWELDGIPVRRNYRDNGIPDPAGQGAPTRNFEFDAYSTSGNGRNLFIPKMADSEGVLKYISGDIDWVHFSFLDGTPLDPKTARQLYDVLMDCCGLQHPETVTWILKGQSLFETKIDQIADYLSGGKALLEVSGEGPRAVRMNQHLTRFADGSTARNHLIAFDNGITSRLRATAADIETAFHNLRSRTPARVIPPFLWAIKNLDPESDTAIGDDEWIFDTLGDALLLRNSADGTIEQFDGQNWIPWGNPTNESLSFPISGNSGLQRSLETRSSQHLTLTPTSGLASEVFSGATALPILDLPSLWPDQMAGRVGTWFQAGQSIIIAPGEPTQEIHTVSSVSPLTITAPLVHNHPEDTLVAVIPLGMAVSPPTSRIVSVLEGEGETILIWQTIPAREYVLEVQNGSEWDAVGEPTFSDSNAHATPVPALQFNAAATYRLREVGTLPEPLTFTQFSFSPDDGEIFLQWTTEPGATYVVESSLNLQSDNWEPISSNRRALANLDELTITIGNEPNRFFRIVEAGGGN